MLVNWVVASLLVVVAVVYGVQRLRYRMAWKEDDEPRIGTNRLREALKETERDSDDA